MAAVIVVVMAMLMQVDREMVNVVEIVGGVGRW